MGRSTAAYQVQQSSTSALVLDESTAPATHSHDARTLVLLQAPIALTPVELAAPNNVCLDRSAWRRLPG